MSNLPSEPEFEQAYKGMIWTQHQLPVWSIAKTYRRARIYT